MAIIAGTTTVDASGNATGTGLSFALYTALVASTKLPDPNNPDPAFLVNGVETPAVRTSLTQARTSTLAALAAQANALAAGLVPYLLAHLTVVATGVAATVPTSGVSLGTLPPTVVKGAAIGPPSAPVTLPVTGSFTIA